MESLIAFFVPPLYHLLFALPDLHGLCLCSCLPPLRRTCVSAVCTACMPAPSLSSVYSFDRPSPLELPVFLLPLVFLSTPHAPPPSLSPLHVFFLLPFSSFFHLTPPFPLSQLPSLAVSLALLSTVGACICCNTGGQHLLWLIDDDLDLKGAEILN
eukprot:6209730-Pleurochrysis_carterae.AAC.1